MQLTLCGLCLLYGFEYEKGEADNPIVNTVLPHDIFQHWVWFLEEREKYRRIFACFASDNVQDDVAAFTVSACSYNIKVLLNA